MKQLVVRLKKAGIVFDDALKLDEVSQIEKRYGFRFPPDLREFLSIGLPISPDFPNWRTGQLHTAQVVVHIEEVLDWPREGLCFDVERNAFWIPEWGARPSKLEEALLLARKKIAEAPRLVPVFAHRFLPCEPLLAGNPILSIHQSDIIYYGTDLFAYLEREFRLRTQKRGNGRRSPRRIRFWSDIIEMRDSELQTQAGDHQTQ